MEQLLLHLVGDYIIQNDNVGIRKKEKSLTGLFYCIFHSITYALIFLLITTWEGVVLIGISHFLIDRWNIVAYFTAFKNNVYKKIHKNNKIKKRLDLSNFGYIKERPFSITIWLYIIHDNIFHLLFNYIIIWYFSS